MPIKSVFIRNPQTGGVKKSSSGKPLRSFKLVTINNRKAIKPQKSLSRTPSQAASKMFSHYCTRLNKKAKCSTTLSLQETTRGSEKKVYRYNAQRAWNKRQVTLKNGTTLKYRFKNVIHSQKQPSKTKKK